MIKFECRKCGFCCKKFGKGKGLPLWEWEVEKIKNAASEKNISVNIKPISAFFDKKSKIAFCMGYAMFNEPCPFLENNSCSIYLIMPIVCRVFPLAKTPFFSKDKEVNFDKFAHCQNFDHRLFIDNYTQYGNIKKMSPKETKKDYREAYGECYDYCFQNDMIGDYLQRIINDLIEKGRIKLRKINELDYEKYKIYSFSEFLEKIGINMRDIFDLFGNHKKLNLFIEDLKKGK